MAKEGDSKVVDSEVSILNRLVQATEESFGKLKKAQEKKDATSFNTLKADLIQAQRRIADYIR